MKLQTKSDLTHNGDKITVLRKFDHDKFMVVQGDNWYRGLSEKYREFTVYSDAIDYMASIQS